MKNYTMIKVDNTDYEFIIISNSYETPLSAINEITNDLLRFKLSNFKVLFDMLLNMGNTSERFVEAFFDGNELNRDSFKFVNVDKRNDIRKFSCNYLAQNSNILDNSVLNSVQKKMLRKEMVF